MVDKELLEAIGQMMEAQEKRLSDMMDTKLAQQRKEIMQDVKALLDTDVQTRFNLLAEDLDILKEKLPGAEDLDAMQEQLDLHYAMLKKHTREISDLKKANYTVHTRRCRIFGAVCFILQGGQHHEYYRTGNEDPGAAPAPAVD